MENTFQGELKCNTLARNDTNVSKRKLENGRTLTLTLQTEKAF